MAKLNFNARQFDPTQGSGVLPVGRYPVFIEASEIRPTKDNDGSAQLQLQLRITDGAFKGMGGAYRLQLFNKKSQQAVDIANKQLSAICHVVGVLDVENASQLHNIPFIIEVGYQKGSEQYTEVKRVLDINGNEPGKAAQPPQPQQGFQPPPQPPQAPQQGWAAPPAPPPQQPQQPAWGQQPQQPAWGQQPQQAPQQPPQQAWGQPQPQVAPPPQPPAWGQPPQPQAPNGQAPGQQSGPPPWGRPQG